MEPVTFLRLQPTLNRLTFVSTVVIQDEMDLQLRRDLVLQLFQKAQKFPGAMTGPTTPQDLAIRCHLPLDELQQRAEGTLAAPAAVLPNTFDQSANKGMPR